MSSRSEVSEPITAGAPDTQPPQRPPRFSRFPNLQVARFSGLYLWALMILIFGVWVPHTFLTSSNAQSIASSGAVTAIVALAALAPLAAGCFDVSVAQGLGTSAIFCGTLMTKVHMGPAEAIVLTLLFGVGVGAINGIVVAWIGVDSFITTLGMTSVLLAIAEALSNYEYVGPLPAGFGNLVGGTAAGIPVIVFYVLAIALIVWYFLEHTAIGRRLHATGASREGARLAGVQTTRYVFASFVVSGLLASVAGVLVAAQLGDLSPSLGPSYLLPAFAACFLGTTQIRLGRFNVWGTVLSLYLVETGITGLQLAGASLWVTDLFNGLVLIAAVAVAVVSQRRTRTRRVDIASAGRRDGLA
jgi:ribose transport system permease protein